MTKIKFNKSSLLVVLRVVVKYVLPAILGWLEGDSHVIQDSVLTFVSDVL